MNPNALPQAIPGGGSVTGAMQLGDIEEFQKALTAGYGTDVAALTGGSALRIQSLDKTMKATIQENKHFRLFNELAKNSATATVDEWTEQSGVGGFLGGSTNTETGNIAESTGAYARRVGLVKYLMTRRQVSFVATLGNNLASAEAVEQQAGAKQLLTDAEFLSFEGDSAVVPTEFDGIYAQIKAGVDDSVVDAGNILDCEGSSLASVNLMNQAAAQISAYGNFGTPTHLFMSQLTQADFDTGLDPAFRVPLADVPGGGIQLGAPVSGIRTSWGNIKAMPDVFIRDEQQQLPFEVTFSALATANTAMKPTSVTLAVASHASSKFGAGHAGLYYYAVAGISAAGQSDVRKSAQQAVAAGEKCTLTITSAGGGETGYAIYRSRKGGTNDTSDFRLVARIPKDGATTEFIDYNREIPGTAKAYVLNMTPGDEAINWRQLLPMLKFPLYPTVSAVVPWAQLMFGYLRITKRRHHVIIKNIVCASQKWKPFV
jgi:hypothetical protein